MSAVLSCAPTLMVASNANVRLDTDWMAMVFRAHRK